MKPDIKIFVSCHKASAVPENALLVPVQAGAATTAERLGMRRDDEGENISEKNGRYCELTVQYWAWKNEEADYYGFFHYRRYLSFSEDIESESVFDRPDGETARLIALDEEKMRGEISRYDLILPVRHTSRYFLSNRMQYRLRHSYRDLKFCIGIIDEEFPEMSKCAHKFLRAKSSYYWNMFIMKKELFFPYCEWLFRILGRHERECPSGQTARVGGYLAERLCAIYMTWLQETKRIKVKHLPAVFFENTVPQ